MHLFGGTIIAKVGADGCYAVGVSRKAPRIITATYPQTAFGIAFKIEDGNLDMLYVCVADVIHQLGLGSTDMRDTLDSWRRLPRHSTTGHKVGETYLSGNLRPAHTRK